MTNISRTQLEQILKTLQSLTAQVDLLLNGHQIDPLVAKRVEELVSKRVCLACGVRIPDDQRVRRGLDEACYGTTRARIRRGETSERAEIEAGKLTPETKSPGRKAKQDIDRAEKTAPTDDELYEKMRQATEQLGGTKPPRRVSVNDPTVKEALAKAEAIDKERKARKKP